ncbi:MAG: AGE family epimerase/isomerase [Bacteroidia bacterium]
MTTTACKFLYLLPILLLWAGCTPDPEEKTDQGMTNEQLRQELTFALNEQLLDKWYPAIIDKEQGGYLSDLDYKWEPNGPQNKSIVTQARHLWVTSKVAMFYPDKPGYRAYADQGYAFLRDKMWDHEMDGFFYTVDRSGEWKSGENDADKWAYGNAFAIFGLAAYYKLTGSEEALDLAKKTFMWLEKYSHDPVNQGYYPFLNREGKAFGRDLPVPAGQPQLGYKDQNPTIHLLEAFAELYPVWEDSLLRARFEETLVTIRDTITRPEGYMNLYFTPDWKEVSYKDSSAESREKHYNIDHVSFGHDIETGFLLLEAAELLGENWYNETLPVAKKLVDHSLEKGFDHEIGGVYEQGYYFPEGMKIVDERKNWWAQAEGFHSLLLFSTIFPEEKSYREGMLLEWDYIKKYLIDQTYGGWYSFGTDHSPETITRNKANVWKSAYHDGRSLMYSLKLLETGGH